MIIGNTPHCGASIRGGHVIALHNNEYSKNSDNHNTDG